MIILLSNIFKGVYSQLLEIFFIRCTKQFYCLGSYSESHEVFTKAKNLFILKNNLSLFKDKISQWELLKLCL